MEQQLVIKLWRKALPDEAFLDTLQDALQQALGDSAVQEGHDIGDKEVNVFMTTSDPRQALRRARDVLERFGVVDGVSAASRLVGGLRFTPLWPPRSTRRFTLP